MVCHRLSLFSIQIVVLMIRKLDGPQELNDFIPPCLITAMMDVPVDHPVSFVRELHELVLNLVAGIVAPAQQLLQ